MRNRGNQRTDKICGDLGQGRGGKGGGLHAKACNQDVDSPVAGGDSFLFSVGVVRAHVDVRVGCVQVQ